MPLQDTLQSPNQTTRVNHDRMLATVAHLGGIFFGFLPPLIIYLLKKRDRPAHFVTLQAKEALNFQITLAIVSIFCSLFFIQLPSVIFILLFWILDVTFSILAGIKSFAGENYRYPYTFRMVK